MSDENNKNNNDQNNDSDQNKKNDQNNDDQNNDKFPAMKRAEELMLKMDEKEKLLLEKEKKLDEQIDSFDKKVAEAKLSGFGQARVEQTVEEKEIESANKLFSDTGLDPFAEPHDAFNRKKK